VDEWVWRVSLWLLFRVVRVRDSSATNVNYELEGYGLNGWRVLLRALSASRTRRLRACSRVERESLIRDTAALSGAMWKFPAVCWMS
jgi:hypothetical protein